MVVVSDTSVLIDLERASLLTPSFHLRFDASVASRIVRMSSFRRRTITSSSTLRPRTFTPRVNR